MRRGERLYTAQFMESSALTEEVSKPSELTCEFRGKDPMDVRRGDYVEVGGKAFIFTQRPSVEKLSNGEYRYTGHLKDESGYMEDGDFTLCDNVTLTQKDVREVQLAKAAIRAGIELLAEKMNVAVEDIRRVYLAGAFGNYMNPASACRIGMIPPVLQDRIVPIGNAAGEGAKLCALNRAEFAYSQALAKNTEFLELASLPQFQDCYVDALEFCEEEDE